MSGLPVKSCRFCGKASALNIDIFGIDSTDLAKAAMAVFPIVLCEDDPLPKYCCRKCATMLRTRYSDNQRFIELNSRWINRLRATKPNHSYIQLMDAIEAAKQDFLNKLKDHGPVTMKFCADRLLSLNKPIVNTFENNGTESPNELSKLRAKSRTSRTGADNVHSTVKLESQATNSATAHKLINIKCMLQNNSDAASVTVGELTIKKTNNTAAVINTSKQDGASSAQIKVERCVVNSEKNVSYDCTHNCQYCQHIFQSEHDLVKHYRQHLRVHIQRIFARKPLPKQLRRGRVIQIDDKQLIRCLICFRIYENKTEILAHWNARKCDFYCLICGKAYPESRTELRAHVQTVHGISHSSLRHLHEEMIKPKTELPVPPVKWRNPMLKCSTCGKEFQNTHARNSHMRLHKPSHAFGELTLPTHSTTDDNYTEMEDSVRIVIKNEPPSDNKAGASKAPMPPKVIVIRGIRTKYNVQTNPNKTLTAPKPTTTPMPLTTAKATTPVRQATPATPISSRGLIKVKALEELLSTRAKRIMFDDTP